VLDDESVSDAGREPAAVPGLSIQRYPVNQPLGVAGSSFDYVFSFFQCLLVRYVGGSLSRSRKEKSFNDSYKTDLGGSSNHESIEMIVPPEIPASNRYAEVESSSPADGPKTDLAVLFAMYTETSAGTESNPQEGMMIALLL